MVLLEAIEGFGALAQETRLRIFRHLMPLAPEQVPAGVIAADLDIPKATLSFHLAHLCRARLLSSIRDGREIKYGIDLEGVRALLHYMTEDCCGGRPELCAAPSEACGCDEAAASAVEIHA